MIKRLSIKNFFGYEDQSVVFSEGINVICGHSRSGKTTIRRAIEWVQKNRPQGSSFVSYWNRGNRNELKTPTEVKVELDNGFAKRIKSKDFNGYIVQRGDIVQDYEAIGPNVPEQVTDLFNFSEINLQRQFDSPFLLSESAAEVARFFNKTIRLDVIDKVLSLAETKRRKNNQALESLSKEKEELDKALDSLLYVQKAGEILTQAENINEQINNNLLKATTLKKVIGDVNDTYRDISRYPSEQEISAVTLYVEKISTIKKTITENSKEYESLNSLLNSAVEQESVLRNYDSINTEQAECLLKKIQIVKKSLENAQNSMRELNRYGDIVFEQTQIIQASTKQLQELNHLVPEICQNCPLF